MVSMRGNGQKHGDETQNTVQTAADQEHPRLARPRRKNLPLARRQETASGIGTPPPAPFKPDPFQLEALAMLEYEDVLVTAPTGSGKTWIAREEIRRLLGEGKRAWYTTPLKALTNSKYQEFIDEFGAENVGILTGDRKENSDAPLIVGTTEIYRNQLFDSLRSGRSQFRSRRARRSSLSRGRRARTRLGRSDHSDAAANPACCCCRRRSETPVILRAGWKKCAACVAA